MAESWKWLWCNTIRKDFCKRLLIWSRTCAIPSQWWWSELNPLNIKGSFNSSSFHITSPSSLYSLYSSYPTVIHLNPQALNDVVFYKKPNTISFFLSLQGVIFCQLPLAATPQSSSVPNIVTLPFLLALFSWLLLPLLYINHGFSTKARTTRGSVKKWV